MLQLIAENPGNSEPVMPIRWCVSPDAIEKLKEMGVTNPHIYLSVWNGDKETMRRVVPLEQAIEYLEFNTVGKNTVTAAIIWTYDHTPSRFRKLVMGGYQHPYSSDNLILRRLDIRSLQELENETAKLDVVVPKEFFAHMPSERERRWVNFLFANEPRDQCEYRRRRILAYTLQPFLVLVAAVVLTTIRVIFAAATLLYGTRGLKLRPILHPFRDSVDEMWEDPGFVSSYHENRSGRWRSSRNNFFAVNSKGEPRPEGFGLMHPALWLLYAGELLVLYEARLDWMHFIGLVFRTLSLIAFAGIIGSLLWDHVLSQMFQGSKSERVLRQKQSANLRVQSRLAEYDTAFADVVCMPALRAQVSTLRKPPISLKFRELKAKVCRPYITG